MQYGPRPLPLFLDMLRSETAASPVRRDAALAGLAAFQSAPRRPPPQSSPRPVATTGSARVLDYGSDARAPAALLVPSLINPPAILDLTAETSLMRWLAGRGVRPLLVDWGVPDDPGLDVAGHVAHRLLPLIDAIDGPVALVGYCLGGTMAIAAAMLRPVAGLALIATPWRFAGLGDQARTRIARLWADGRPTAERLGAVPIELLQAGFWALDADKAVRKYEAFARLDPASDEAAAFVALEDWANAGAPLALAAGRELFEAMIGDDVTGRGEWRVGGRTIDPGSLACPTIEFVAANDRIVPAATSAGLGDPASIGAGHVGMIVGSRRMLLWERLAAWLRERQMTGKP